MSLMLCVESSAKVASIAIFENDVVLYGLTVNHKRNHSGVLMTMIKEAFGTIERTPSDIGFIAVSVGPGSFTGLRIGVDIVKGMAYALSVPVIPVTTPEALSYNVRPFFGLCCPVIDAGNNRVYGQVFYCAGDGSREESDVVAEPIEDFIKRIKALKDERHKDDNILFAGDAAGMYKELFYKTFRERTLFPPAGGEYQNAISVGFAAQRLLKEERICNAGDLVPFYLLRSKAEQIKVPNIRTDTV